MIARIIAVDPFDLVVFGGTGDLALRKLLPGLYYRDHDRQLGPESRIIAVARRRIEARPVDDVHGGGHASIFSTGRTSIELAPAHHLSSRIRHRYYHR